MSPLLASAAGLLVALLSACAQVLFKLSSLSAQRGILAKLRDPRFTGGILLFAVCPLISYFVLKAIDYSLYYALTALSHVCIVLLSRVFLHEGMDKWKASGIGLIIAGLIVYHL
ncbi:MAG: EamA family transporter [Spirochaetes bacterium]|nr:EamA family transporter [Spirochaetota bacterium]MBU0956670.1 EamA family transporter [Spirochaetota bacterium]